MPGAGEAGFAFLEGRWVDWLEGTQWQKCWQAISVSKDNAPSQSRKEGVR